MFVVWMAGMALLCEAPPPTRLAPAAQIIDLGYRHDRIICQGFRDEFKGVILVWDELRGRDHVRDKWALLGASGERGAPKGKRVLRLIEQ